MEDILNSLSIHITVSGVQAGTTLTSTLLKVMFTIHLCPIISEKYILLIVLIWWMVMIEASKYYWFYSAIMTAPNIITDFYQNGTAELKIIKFAIAIWLTIEKDTYPRLNLTHLCCFPSKSFHVTVG